MGRDGFRRGEVSDPGANDDGLLQNRIGHALVSRGTRRLAAQFSAGREAERTVSTVSAPRYGRISGIGYCVTRATRRRTAKGPAKLRSTALRSLGVASASESGPGADDIWASIRVGLRGHELFMLLMCAAKSEGHVPSFR